MPAYKDTARNTWFTKFCYKDWTGTARWVTKRGFSTKKEALQWERDFLTEKSGTVDMTFEAFVKIYLRDLSPRIKETTLMLKESIIEVIHHSFSFSDWYPYHIFYLPSLL